MRINIFCCGTTTTTRATTTTIIIMIIIIITTIIATTASFSLSSLETYHSNSYAVCLKHDILPQGDVGSVAVKDGAALD